MEQYRALLGQVARQESRIAVFWSVVLVAVIGAVFWVNAVNVLRDIRSDLAQDAYDTYSGIYYIKDDSSVSSFRLYDRWATVDFQQGAYVHLYVNSPVEWLQTDYGAYEGAVVYGRNSLIVVDLQPEE